MRLTGGQTLVQCLEAQGVDAVFGLPGVQLDWAFDALYLERDAITVYHTRHEQAVSYMADGYARTTGRVGVCLTVPGPGLLNAMAGLATAYACSSPVLCITGQIPSRHIGKGRGLLHEIKDQLQTVRSVTKWAAAATRPEDIPSVVREAFRQLRTGRARPVAIEVAPDVLQASGDVASFARVEVARQEGDPELVERAAKVLGRAKRPSIFVGGGVLRSGASEPLLHLAEMLEAPVIMSSSGKGALSDRHRLAQSMVAAEDLLPAADVVLIVGTRFLQPAFSTWGPRDGQTLIQIDVDPEEIGRNSPVAIGIVADAHWGLTELLNRVPRHNGSRSSRRDELAAAKQKADTRLATLEPLRSYALAIREAVPDDGVVVTDLTQVGYWSYFGGFPVYEPRTLITSGYQGTLGFAFPTALGARVGAPEKKVVSISGDGGFMYNVQEMSTMVRHGLNVVAIVFNDNAFGNVRRIQKESFGGRVVASDLRNPDFVRLAELFGVEGRRAESPGALRAALQDALGRDRPGLIEVPLGEMPNPWPVIRAGSRE
ncbi:MAG TPA: thiamine pyrophosphate-dependent enzyme [bacterium]|nr:thiamine pyrophosphate-dependent enzyme [bacterium]